MRRRGSRRGGAAGRVNYLPSKKEAAPTSTTISRPVTSNIACRLGWWWCGVSVNVVKVADLIARKGNLPRHRASSRRSRSPVGGVCKSVYERRPRVPKDNGAGGDKACDEPSAGVAMWCTEGA